MPHKNDLELFLPRAGMIYPPACRFLKRKRQDVRVMISFEKAGFAEPGKGPRRRAKRVIDEALAEMFTLGMQPEIISHLSAGGGGLLDFLCALKHNVTWAKRIGESTFIQLCERLVKARRAWQENPRPPFDPNQQSKTARSIDALLGATEGRWNGVEFEIYELVGGWEEGEDENGNDKNNSESSTPLDSTTGLFDGMQIDMGDLTTALEDFINEDAIREGVEQMDLNDRMDIDDN
ncbi:hypothetical protein K445DRAFT_10081 [Daldinia sp. EC12]|nr:hypothetical protein F4774DRAFT_425947 [Daldinia eschscholtzii]OTB17370.1 hypothetical protein K445DRAFT_10081 [Daldinia sp. EC12]